MKLRANPENYGTWVAGLFDIINAARVRIEPSYVSVAGEKGAEMHLTRDSARSI